MSEYVAPTESRRALPHARGLLHAQRRVRWYIKHELCREINTHHHEENENAIQWWWTWWQRQEEKRLLYLSKRDAWVGEMPRNPSPGTAARPQPSRILRVGPRYLPLRFECDADYFFRAGSSWTTSNLVLLLVVKFRKRFARAHRGRSGAPRAGSISRPSQLNGQPEFVPSSHIPFRRFTKDP